jgi:dipeptidase D
MNHIVVATSQRSSVNSAKIRISNTVKSTFKLAGARVEQTEGYPGWNPNPDSEILRITVESYKRLFHSDPAVKAIHAGLECGLFLEKYPYLDMISIGPTIVDPHSPSERISIKTTEKFWALLLDVLENIPEALNDHSTGSKSVFATPQTGHTQSSGISSKAVPGEIPPSGSPSMGSYI